MICGLPAKYLNDLYPGIRYDRELLPGVFQCVAYSGESGTKYYITS